MGAAGYVAMYDEQKVRSAYKELYPNNDIDADWWYLKTITAELGVSGKWILDYHDDQGHHDGMRNEFWFDSEEAQERCLKAVAKAKGAALVEVWT